MKKHHVNKLLSSSEQAISSFFQKIPEIFILLAIPAVLFAYIFVKPQLTQNKNSTKNNNFEVMQGDNGSNVDTALRTLMNDVQTEMTSGSSAAKLDNQASRSAKMSQSMPKLDLVGPWSCETSNQDGLTTKLYIDSKLIKLISQTTQGTEHILLKDGCLYSWLNNGGGKKQCSGVQEILSIAELTSQSGLFDMTSLIDEMGGQSAEMYKSLAASCKKSSLNSAIFSVPQGIKWVEDDVIKLEK